MQCRAQSRKVNQKSIVSLNDIGASRQKLALRRRGQPVSNPGDCLRGRAAVGMDVLPGDVRNALPVTIRFAIENDAHLLTLALVSKPFASEKKPEFSRGMLKRGSPVLASRATLEMSCIPYRHSSTMRSILANRTSAPSSISSAERATKPRSRIAKTMASKIGLYALSKGQLMKT